MFYCYIQNYVKPDQIIFIYFFFFFVKFMRLDLTEKIYSMKLIVDEEFYCQTENQIRIYSLNQVS